MKKIFLLILVLLFSSSVYAEDFVVVNSNDWETVYLGQIYANIKGLDSKFVLDFQQGIELLKLIPSEVDSVLLIETSPIISNMDSRLKDKGFEIEKLSGDVSEVNLELLEKSELNSLILLDGSFGHNAISVGGYAVASKKMPVFVDRKNLPVLTGYEAMSYAGLDSSTREQYESIILESINEGDKFSNNLEILKKHLELAERKQILLTDGSIIEAELLKGADPVLLVGNTNVPEDIIQAIKDSGVSVWVAVGTDVVGNARIIKEETGLSIFIKFAQGRNEQQFPLDTFPIPTFDYMLDITDVSYNKATQKIEITFENSGDNFLVFKGDYDVLQEDSVTNSFGDEKGIFIPEKSSLTLEYNSDQGSLLSYNVLLGEDEKALEYLLQGTATMKEIDFVDNSEIIIDKVVYDNSIKRFKVYVSNVGVEKAYYRAEINLNIDEDLETFSSEEVAVLAGEQSMIKVRAVLEPIDIEDNPEIDVEAKYGAREGILIKSTMVSIPLVVKGFNWLYLVVLLIVIVLIAVVFIFAKKKKTNKKSDKKEVTKKKPSMKKTSSKRKKSSKK